MNRPAPISERGRYAPLSERGRLEDLIEQADAQEQELYKQLEVIRNLRSGAIRRLYSLALMEGLSG